MTLCCFGCRACDHKEDMSNALPPVSSLSGFSGSADPQESQIRLRRAQGGLLTGVSAGLARRFCVDTSLVRLAFVVLGLTGVGLLAYVAAFVRMREVDTRELADNWPTETPKVVGLGLFTTGLMLLLHRLGLSVLSDSFFWPVLVVAAGFGVVSWQLSLERQQRLASAFQPDSRYGALRIAAGVVVVAVGIFAALAGEVSFSALGSSAFALVLILGGLAVVFGPWASILLNDVSNERRQRVRADERADLAAHLHDSVLQTLALIQRTDDPSEAASLARRQERELRSWLYSRPESFVHSDVDLQSLFESAAADVEDRHSVPIELVVVGEVEVDDSVITLAKAAREAMVNASKFSGAPQISVFVEGEAGQVEVWVRDRGVGFDTDAIDPDRRGIRDSVRGRLARIGGEATITSTPGDGAEVYLLLPAQRKASP